MIFDQKPGESREKVTPMSGTTMFQIEGKKHNKCILTLRHAQELSITSTQLYRFY